MPATPDPEPFNADALLEEISASRRPFTLKGETFYLLPPTAWTDDIIEAAGRDDLLGICRGILAADYDRFIAAGGSSMILQRIYERVFGAPMGESSASPPSSVSTARPSKPTSSTVTESTSSTSEPPASHTVGSDR